MTAHNHREGAWRADCPACGMPEHQRPEWTTVAVLCAIVVVEVAAVLVCIAVLVSRGSGQ